VEYAPFVELDVFATAVLLIVLVSSRISTPRLASGRRFRSIVLLTIGVLFCDAVGMLPSGQSFPGAAALLWGSNFLYFVLSGAIAFSWLVYSLVELKPSLRISTLDWIGISFPFFVLMAADGASFRYKLLFFIDSANFYHRGPYFYLQTVVCFGYLLTSAAVALVQMCKETLLEKRRRCLWMGTFVVMPLIGGTLQILHYGLLLLWPCTALSLLLVYVGIQNQQISLDSLTELNNRGRFDRHLYNRCNAYDGKPLLFLFLLDVDNFKSINDRWGHVVGDEALIQASQLLKSVFAGRNAFLARYGGDEFAAIFSCEDADEVAGVLADMEDKQQCFNNAPGHPPYELRFSIGCAQYDPQRHTDCARFIADADMRMYQQKKQRQENLNGKAFVSSRRHG